MPNIANAFVQAQQHQQTGRHFKAEQLYRQVVRADPLHADAWCLLGATCQAQGKVTEAFGCFQRAIQVDPQHANARNYLGVLLAEQGKLAEAVVLFQEALRLDPENAEIHTNLGSALARLGQVAAALTSYQQALRLQPNDAHAHYNVGLLLKGMNQPDTAMVHFQRALAGNPHHAGAAAELEQCLASANAQTTPRQITVKALGHFNLGVVLTSQGKLDDAIRHYRQALQLNPDDANVHVNLGAVLQKQEKMIDAVASYRAALRLKPDFAEACNNLGFALMDLGQFGESMEQLDHALRLKPDFAAAHWTRAQLRLLQGDFKHGWPEYEWRWTQPGFAKRGFPQPQWRGSPINESFQPNGKKGRSDRTILLHAEQGLGDTLQFIRYAALVKKQFGKVIVEVQPPLMRLLAGVAGIDRLLPQGARLAGFDVHAPLLSLPGIFHDPGQPVPANIPYLHADPKLVAYWRKEVDSLQGFKIGIAWQGNPQYHHDKRRSILLAKFACLSRLPGVQLFSLQKGPGTEQLQAACGTGGNAATSFPLIDLGRRLDEANGPFMDTAALMKCLDLVIASDSAVAHLAGALGVPVWVALCDVPDWRWLLEREDSPWYPTMRLFRQAIPGDWDDVFEQIADALRSALAGKSG